MLRRFYKYKGRGIQSISAALALLVLILPLTACNRGGAAEQTLPEGMERFTARFLGVFDTVTTLVAISESREAFEAFASQAEEELTRYHELFNTFESFEGVNNLKTVNEMAGLSPVEVDPVIIQLMDQGLRANARSNGKVNMAFGPVLEIWHDYRDHGLRYPEEATLPSEEALREADQYTDITKIEIDRAVNTVFLTEEEMSLDVGSGAKGLAVELVAESLKLSGLENFLLSVGGNVRSAGYRDAGSERWRVGIQDPDQDEGQYIEIVHIEEMAVVTSGVYERYYTVDGQRYHHIIHPDSLFPVYNFDSVTIIAPDSGLADSLTTALFNMPLDEGMAMIEDLEGVAALWIKDGEITRSSRMSEFLAD